MISHSRTNVTTRSELVISFFVAFTMMIQTDIMPPYCSSFLPVPLRSFLDTTPSPLCLALTMPVKRSMVTATISQNMSRPLGSTNADTAVTIVVISDFFRNEMMEVFM